MHFFTLAFVVLLCGCAMPPKPPGQNQSNEQNSSLDAATSAAAAAAAAVSAGQSSGHESRQGTSSMPVIVVCVNNASPNAYCLRPNTEGPVGRKFEETK